MERHSFIARMPDEPGALLKAAEAIRRYGGNINRIHFDRRIDPGTVFFEVTAPQEAHACISRELLQLGYLKTALESYASLRFHVYLPNRPGALLELLHHTTPVGANISFIDFDERGSHPDRVTISMLLPVQDRQGTESSESTDRLLTSLKTRFRIEIIEYDPTGESLDETVFYIRFAQRLRPLVGEAEEDFLLRLLGDINHIVQELSRQGRDPRTVFESVIQTGTMLRESTGKKFHADVQRIELPCGDELLCFQLPCGGNVYLLSTPEGILMIDSGFGIYHADILEMFERYGVDIATGLDRILITHADADHAGGAGLFSVPSQMHPGTMEILDRANRAYGSKVEHSILEEVYTRLINIFSRFSPPSRRVLFSTTPAGRYGGFGLIDRVSFSDLDLLVLEGMGGHLHGQVYFLSPSHGLLFTGDTLINTSTLTEERRSFIRHADLLMTSVNVDGTIARQEREALLAIARREDARLRPSGGRCLICGGHGAVSCLSGDYLEVFGEVERYLP